MYFFCFFSLRGSGESKATNMPPQKDIVKIAIQMPGAYPQLIQLDQVLTIFCC